MDKRTQGRSRKSDHLCRRCVEEEGVQGNNIKQKIPTEKGTRKKSTGERKKYLIRGFWREIRLGRNKSS